ncbi:MAG TPA: hypothetical protein VHE61_23585 [Opitutaceae bacterium]|nr:hypothetical protein [Opitutaceae bacterium]
MPKTDPLWLLFYLGVALFGGWGGHVAAEEAPSAVPVWFLAFAGLLGVLFSALVVARGLWSRLGQSRDPAILDTPLWACSPLNPQSNRLAQVLFFAGVGIEWIVEAPGSRFESAGFFPLALAAGIAGGLVLFRWAYRRGRRRQGSGNGEWFERQVKAAKHEQSGLG